MKSAELERKNFDDVDALVRRVGRIFGYSGLDVEVKPNAGWYTQVLPGSIKLVVDPLMLRPKDLKDATGGTLDRPSTIPDEHYTIYGTCHELGHVEDFLDPVMSRKEQQKMSASDRFFWNVLDDAVINRRLTNIPLLHTITDRIYEEILFPIDDYTKLPKHVQFMYGILLKSVTPNRDVIFDGEVDEVLTLLDGLKNGRRPYEIYNDMADPRTSLKKRRTIANRFVKPIYDSFLEEDKQRRGQNQQGQSESSPNDDGNGSSGDADEWQEAYEAYSQASPCGQHGDHDQTGQNGENGDSMGEGDEEGQVHASCPHEAIEEAGGALKKQREENQKRNASSKSGSGAEPGTATALGAGSLAGELKLSPADAFRYQNAIDTYRTQIHQVSRIFQKLAVPTIEYTSPRYRHRATTDGAHLSPRDLFRVAIAKYSEQDQAIWRSVETISKKEGLSFSGLDVHLLVDASNSMEGENAESAASCFVMLAEGLEAACRDVEKYDQSAPRPDVRLQVILFGDSAKTIVPLEQDIDSPKKGQAFTTILAASGSSTYVADAIYLTKRSARLYPERTQLVYIITDGAFSDRSEAGKAIKGNAENFHAVQYILKSSDTSPIARTFAHIGDAKELPLHLEKQLERLSHDLGA